jgi:hypothetical protein
MALVHSLTTVSSHTAQVSWDNPTM